ncbi:hypothetical protein PSNVIR_00004 [Pseudomonas sp. Nvir]|nr:hypothetical protein PSNVIR_00004 [Pseudomonas sp. Nvir]
MVPTHPWVEPMNSQDLPATNGWAVPMLFFSWVISLLLLVRTPSAVPTRLLSRLTADASALVAAKALAAAAAAAASVATLSVTATQVLPFQRFGVFALPVVSIHRFWEIRSATAGAVDWYNTLPLVPAASDAACAACCAAVTLPLVVVRLFCSPVIAWPCVVSLPSLSLTLVLRLCTAKASALLWATAKALAAAAAASVATLSVTATQALPFQRFGVLALPVVSIHRFCARRLSVAGAVEP